MKAPGSFFLWLAGALFATGGFFPSQANADGGGGGVVGSHGNGGEESPEDDGTRIFLPLSSPRSSLQGHLPSQSLRVSAGTSHTAKRVVFRQPGTRNPRRPQR